MRKPYQENCRAFFPARSIHIEGVRSERETGYEQLPAEMVAIEGIVWYKEERVYM